MTVELCASSRNALPAAAAGEVAALVSIKVAGAGGRGPVDVICTVDTSGSMADAKGLVEDCLEKMVAGLGDGDRLGVVGFDNTARVLLPLTQMTREGKAAAAERVQKVKVGGGTNIEAALRETFHMVAGSMPHEAAAAVVLFLTDGRPTAGARERKALLALARGHFTAATDSHYHSLSMFTLGFTPQHDERFLFELADYGRGCYSYIDDREQIAPCWDACLRFATTLAACDVRLTVTAAAPARVEQIHSRYDIDHDTVRLADITAHNDRHVLLRLWVPEASAAGADAPVATARVTYYDVAAGDYCEAQCAVCVTRGDGATVNRVVEIHRMRLLASKALERAGQLGRGSRDEAAELIKNVEGIIEGSCVKDAPDCRDLLRDLAACRYGLSAAGAVLSASSTIAYGAPRVRRGGHNRQSGTLPQAPSVGAVSAGAVLPGMLLLHDGAGHVVRNRQTSKAGKHGAAKVMLEIAHGATGKKATVVFPAQAEVQIMTALPPTTSGSESSTNCDVCAGASDTVTSFPCGHVACPACIAVSEECCVCSG